MKSSSVSLQKRYSSWTREDGSKCRSWVWYARWRSPEGRDVWRSLGTQDKAQAQLMQLKIVESLAAAAPSAPKRLDWAAAWQAHEALATYAAKGTLRTRRANWERFWNWARVDREGWPAIQFLDEVTRGRVLAWREYLANLEKPWQPSTINYAVCGCATVYNSLEDHERYEGPMPFSKVRALPKGRVRHDFLTLPEVEVYLSRARELDDSLFVYCALAIYTGLRAPSEALAARWDWVHWSPDGTSGYIQVPHEDVDFKVKDKEARAIPLAARLVEILRPRRGLGRAFIVAPHVPLLPAPDLHLPRSEQRQHYRWPGYMRIRALSKVVEGKTISSYTFRRTFASILMQQGVPYYKAMEWMGHSSVAMLQRYAQLTAMDDDINRAFPPALPAESGGSL